VRYYTKKDLIKKFNIPSLYLDVFLSCESILKIFQRSDLDKKTLLLSEERLKTFVDKVNYIFDYAKLKY
jgi:hypothetical protein